MEFNDKGFKSLFFAEVSQFYLMRRLNLGAHFAYAGYTAVADPFSSTIEKLRIYIALLHKHKQRG